MRWAAGGANDVDASITARGVLTPLELELDLLAVTPIPEDAFAPSGCGVLGRQMGLRTFALPTCTTILPELIIPSVRSPGPGAKDLLRVLATTRRWNCSSSRACGLAGSPRRHVHQEGR